jgi:hypothetical protein
MAFNTTLKHFTSSQELAPLWATAQNYLLNQLVLEDDIIYRCAIAHTSSVFTTDLGAGRWVAVSAAGAQGSKNYIANGDFEDNNTTGWSLFNTTLTSKIPTGSITAGAASITSFAVDSTTPIAGTYDLRVASSGALTAGQGFISDAFTIDREDQAKPLAFSFAYEAVSGTMDFSGTSNNTFAVYIYDVSGSAWIQPAGVYNLVQSSGVGIASGTFQTTATGTQYRIAVVCITATAGAVEMRFDTFQLGPQGAVQGAPVTDWQDYTPTVTGMGTGSSVSSAKYRRVGDTIEVEARIQASVAGSGASGITLSLPANIDTSKLSNILTAYITFGVANFFNNSTISYSDQWSVVYDSSSTSQVRVVKGGTGTLLTGADMNLNSRVVYNFKFPAAGLSSSVQMSNDTDTRVVAFYRRNDGGTFTTITTSATVITSLGNTFVDTHAAWDSTNNWYRIPVSGVYRITGSIFVGAISVANQFAICSILVDSVNVGDVASEYNNETVNSLSATISGSLVRFLNAGQVVQLAGRVGSGTAVAGQFNPTYLSVERLSGPATIAASETVALQRFSTSGQIVNSGVASIVDFPTSGFDTHSSWRSASGSYSALTGTWSVTNPAFIVPVSGVYHVSGSVGWGSATFTGTNNQILVTKNSSAVFSSSDFTQVTSSAIKIAAFSGLVKCVAGDAIQVYASHDAGTARSLQVFTSDRTTLNIVRVGN